VIDATVCKICESKITWSMDRCQVCRLDLGAPLQRELDDEREKAALRARYAAARTSAEIGGFVDRLNEFEHEVRTKSVATINVSVDMLAQIVESKNALYATYSKLVASEIRLPASRQDDRRRSSIEGLLFGSLASNIRYAALSIGNKGLTSYGECTMILKDVALKPSATVLESNSYKFVGVHKLRSEDTIPPGYRATWENRHLLATAKLAKIVAAAQPSLTAAEILIFSEGNRETDEFIEIHIWGPFGDQAIEAVALPASEKVSAERAPAVLRIRDRMLEQNKRCDFI